MSQPRRVTAKFRKMLPIYRLFCVQGDCDFSEDAALAQFVFESTGKNAVGLDMQANGKRNGYAVGKHWMDVTVAGWIENIMDCLMFVHELYDDPEFQPFHWWLDKVVKEPVAKKTGRGEKYNLWFLQGALP